MSKPADLPASTILICGPRPDAVGGGPTHIRNLWASPLSGCFRLEFFQTGSRGAESPARAEAVPARVLRLITSPFALGARIAAIRPSIVHINSAPDLRAFWRDTALLAVAKLFRRKVVFQLHGGSLASLTSSGFMRAVARAVFNTPDVLVVLADISRHELRALGGSSRVELIPNGVDIPALAGARVREHDGRLRRLGFLGRLVEEKGLFATIDALATLRDDPDFSSLELGIAGSGDDRERVREHAHARGVAHAVKFLGTVSGDSKVAFLQETDVLILVGSHNEGMPYALLEAMAVGTPVIASAVGGNVDVIRDRIDGRVVPPDNPEALAAAVRDLAADPRALREMSNIVAARAAAEFSLDQLASRFCSLYSSLGAQIAGGK